MYKLKIFSLNFIRKENDESKKISRNPINMFLTDLGFFFPGKINPVQNTPVHTCYSLRLVATVGYAATVRKRILWSRSTLLSSKFNGFHFLFSFPFFFSREEQPHKLTVCLCHVHLRLEAFLKKTWDYKLHSKKRGQFFGPTEYVAGWAPAHHSLPRANFIYIYFIMI
jgi:hypothetical protein